MLPVCYLFDSIHTSAKGNWKIRKAETAETETVLIRLISNVLVCSQANTPATELAESDLSFLNWTIVYNCLPSNFSGLRWTLNHQ